MYRFKTKKECIEEYQEYRKSRSLSSNESEWRTHFGFNDAGDMDYLLGTKITKKMFNELKTLKGTWDSVKIPNIGPNQENKKDWFITYRMVKSDKRDIIKEILK